MATETEIIRPLSTPVSNPLSNDMIRSYHTSDLSVLEFLVDEFKGVITDEFNRGLVA